MSTTPVQTIAFLGATGGCTLPVLERTLKAGHHARALARTPAKLRTLLINTRGVAAELVDRNLTIIAGAASDAAAMRALLRADGGEEKVLVDTIVSGIGGTPHLVWWNPITPATIDDPHICETATRGIEAALRELLAEGYRVPSRSVAAQGGKPVMVSISTTGVSRLRRDVPWLLLPLYHWLGSVPHKDKRLMEDRVVAAKEEGTLQGFVIVRPSLLLDGEAKGLKALRVGWERTKKTENAPGPTIGYTINREDVANWIWEEAILNSEKWGGRCVSLTY